MTLIDASRAVRARWSPQTTRLTVALLALALFHVLVEDVVDHERHELVLALDRETRAAVRPIAPAFHPAAAIASRLGGEWLAVVVALCAAALVATRRRYEAGIVVAGTLTAWGASLALVACGLTVWALGRGASRRRRTLLFTAAGVATSIVGVSRIVLDAHWLSDVLGGVALGAAWTSLVVTAAESWLHARSRAAEVPAASNHPFLRLGEAGRT